jgi:hypothetical protein
MEQGVTEAQWLMFLDNWSSYKRNCRLTDEREKMDQLFACLSSSLKLTAQGNHLREVATEVLMLAVTIQSTLINQVKFLSLGQERGETAVSFLARLRGEAAQCNFNVECSNCQTMISYEDKLLTHQLVRAILDPTIQEKVLTQAAGGKELSLKEVMAICEAQEVGKRSQGLLM